MKKFFIAFLFVVATFSSQTAFAWDGHRGGYDRGWNRPVYHNDYGHRGNYGRYDDYRSHHHSGDDFLFGVLAGTIAGVIISQPPSAYYNYDPPVYPRRCRTEWRPVDLYDRFGRQLGQNVTVCE